jgi:serine-type D-Ala-D-Ala endopeptidase (penicillin-binding protein 7)
MMIKIFSQLMVVGMIFQFFPADAGQVEQLVTLPESSDRSFDLFEAYQFMSHLPASSNTLMVPEKLDSNSLGVVTSAQSAVVVDRKSGEILFEKNIHEPRAIGSITKLMAAYVFLQGNPDLNAPASILSKDYRSGGRLNISIGDTVTVGDLFMASLVSSDNSATASLVRLSGMSQGDFVARMNEVASEIGMKHTTFDDETGLSSKNRSVVTDIAIMLDHFLENDLIRTLTQVSKTTVVGSSGMTYVLESTDELLNTFVNQNPYKIELAKTGYLPEAGYCLGSVFSYNDDQEIMVIVLGSDSKTGRFQDVKSLAVWAYDTFSWTNVR